MKKTVNYDQYALQLGLMGFLEKFIVILLSFWGGTGSIKTRIPGTSILKNIEKENE